MPADRRPRLRKSATKRKIPKYLAGATDEDVHTFVIRKLQEKIGVLAGKIHTGRSRNEQVSLDVRLYLRASAETILGQIAALIDALLALAITIQKP